MAIVAYENRRIRTIRSTWIILLITLVLAGALTAGFSAMANLDPATGERVGRGTLISVLAVLLSPIVLVPLSVMAAQSFGGEYRFGMIRLTLSTFPRRSFTRSRMMPASSRSRARSASSAVRAAGAPRRTLDLEVPSARHARRWETPSFVTTWAVAARRLAGLTIFPPRPP